MTDDAQAKALLDRWWHSTEEASTDHVIGHSEDEWIRLEQAITLALQQARRAGLEEAAKEARRIAEIADAKLEGCDGDEFIALNTMIGAFGTYEKWLRQRARE